MPKQNEASVATSGVAIQTYKESMRVDSAATDMCSITCAEVSYTIGGCQYDEELVVRFGEGHWFGDVTLTPGSEINLEYVDHLKFNPKLQSFTIDGDTLKINGWSKTGKYEVVIGAYSDRISKTWD